MYTSRNSIWLACITISIILLWCTVQPSYADTTEEEHHLVENNDEDNSADEQMNDFLDLYRRASLRPVVLHQRASLRPFAGKRASLRPVAGKRASLRPSTGKRASLRPANYAGKRKRRDVMFNDE